MKKYSFIFILLIFLAACAPQSTSTPEAPLRATDIPPTEAPTAEAQPAVEALGVSLQQTQSEETAH